MASLIHNLQKGTIIKCSVCTSPIKNAYFTHVCEYRPTRVKNNIPIKIYCFICLTEKGQCKYCKLPYLSKSSISL